MKINSKYFISGKNKTTSIITNIIADRSIEYFNTDKEFAYLHKILTLCRKTTASNTQKNNGLTRLYTMLGLSDDQIAVRLFDTATTSDPVTVTAEPVAATTKSPEEIEAERLRILRAKAKDVATKLINFFSEFNFSPSYRFINSIARATNKVSYVNNYFMVQDHMYAKSISEKTKSSEFKEIVSALKDINPEHIINTRFELFFGEPGAGKTVKATALSDSVVVCSSDMLPTDLMQNFAFADGKAEFQKSDLWIAMEEGKTITLDEVNMLPFESLRFLQGITDGKETFDYKGHNIKIHPDFKIYATMNLNVNGQCIPLPSPLVDRAYDIVEFKLTADDLVSALV